jgi:hypothetical protein
MISNQSSPAEGSGDADTPPTDATVDSNVIAHDAAWRQARDAWDALGRWKRGEIPAAILAAVLVESGRSIRDWNRIGDIDLIRDRARRT